MQVERRTRLNRSNLVAAGESGERVSNTWVTYLLEWDNLLKGGLIPHILPWWYHRGRKGSPQGESPGDGPETYQLVGGVMAHQG